jgi:hypothetical protein
LDDGQLSELVARTRSIIERVLLDRGEAFASAVARDRGTELRFEDVEAVVARDIIDSGELAVDLQLVVSVVQQLLLKPPEDVRVYLRGLADTYTLFAFMRETPDVQSAVVKMFSDGDIWLDTTVVLPLLAEELLDEAERQHTSMIQATRECGLGLHVTAGVIEEIDSHMTRTLSWYRNIDHNRGEPPFLFSAYKTAGRPLDELPNWLQTFRGDRRPEDDIADYLDAAHGIDLQSLKDDLDSADPALRANISEVGTRLGAGDVGLEADVKRRLIEQAKHR